MALEQGIGPIMPYMYILYRYIISKGIRVIFVSDRPRSESHRVKYNLSRFGITKYYLIMGVDSKKQKQQIYLDLIAEYNVLAILDDQPHMNHVPEFVKFPSLYRDRV